MVLPIPNTTARAAVALAGAAGTLLLAGCGVFGGPDVQRNEAGTVTAPATTGGYALEVGDCLTDPGEGEVSEVTIVPCAEDHAYEAYAGKNLPAGDFPGTKTVEAEAREFCTTEFEKFAGTPYDDSELLIRHLHPSQDSWKDRGGREILCLVSEPDGSAATGSLKDARR